MRLTQQAESSLRRGMGRLPIPVSRHRDGTAPPFGDSRGEFHPSKHTRFLPDCPMPSATRGREHSSACPAPGMIQEWR
jgi:hypothetical protein